MGYCASRQWPLKFDFELTNEKSIGTLYNDATLLFYDWSIQIWMIRQTLSDLRSTVYKTQLPGIRGNVNRPCPRATPSVSASVAPMIGSAIRYQPIVRKAPSSISAICLTQLTDIRYLHVCMLYELVFFDFVCNYVPNIHHQHKSLDHWVMLAS